jgi:hypothetical protein
MNILYIGSGNSANLYKNLDLSKYTVVCANNAWRLFSDSSFDYWIHSGDFPREWHPPNKNYIHEISYNEYKNSSVNICNRFEIKTTSAQHYIGYTIFFQGLYYIMDTLSPTKISLLGFDHDYNEEKVKKWEINGKPTPHNKFLKDSSQSIAEWANSFFEGMQSDSFYGHGTPDPLRLSKKHLVEKFNIAIDIAIRLNIELVNLSPVESDINIIKKEKNLCLTST